MPVPPPELVYGNEEPEAELTEDALIRELRAELAAERERCRRLRQIVDKQTQAEFEARAALAAERELYRDALEASRAETVRAVDALVMVKAELARLGLSTSGSGRAIDSAVKGDEK